MSMLMTLSENSKRKKEHILQNTVETNVRHKYQSVLNFYITKTYSKVRIFREILCFMEIS